MAKFSKLLRKTDATKRLSVPMKYFKSLPSFNGGHAVKLQAMDEGGNVWTFRCSIRKKGPHPKPVLSNGWLEFVSAKKLEVGDRIMFCNATNHNTGTVPSHRVRVEKQIKIFGTIIGYAPF